MSDKKGRIYRIHDVATGDVKFCRASTMAQAVNFVTRDRFRVSVATPDDTLGVARNEILDATVPGVHPDQAPLGLPEKANVP